MITAARCVGDCTNQYLNWWVLGPVIAFFSVVIFVGLMATMHEMNPDPGWRARQAEIRKLEQEKRLRQLRDEAPPPVP